MKNSGIQIKSVDMQKLRNFTPKEIQDFEFFLKKVEKLNWSNSPLFYKHSNGSFISFANIQRRIISVHEKALHPFNIDKFVPVHGKHFKMNDCGYKEALKLLQEINRSTRSRFKPRFAKIHEMPEHYFNK